MAGGILTDEVDLPDPPVGSPTVILLGQPGIDNEEEDQLAYFDFNYVTDPPNDEFVDEVGQLNDNWQEVADKINPFNQKPADFTGITVPVGTEAFDPEHVGSEDRIAVWNGTTWIRSLNHTTSWDTWELVPVRAPRLIRTGFPLVYRLNQVTRRVVLMGGVQFDAGAGPWTTNTTYEITTDAALPVSLAPVGDLSYQQAATGQVTVANQFASAIIEIKAATGPDRTAISVRYQGDAGGGNFIMLDGIEWWYE